MIDPAAIPRIDGNMAELLAHADSVGTAGIALADIGERVHLTWQGLAAVYIAPEAGQLLAATGPAMSVSASVGEDLGDVTRALRVYATDTAEIQARLDILRGEASALVAAYGAAQDESTTITLDERGAEVSAAVAAQIAAWETAQLRCANAIRALTGAPLYNSAATLVEYGGTTTVYPEAPAGPTREIFPIDETPQLGSAPYPEIVLGPQILINVPAPLTTGIIDGPGSLGPDIGAGGIIYDATTPDPTPDGAETPDSGVPEPQLPETPIGEQLATAPTYPGRLLPITSGPPDGVLVKRAPDGSVTNYTEYDANGLAVKRVDLTGRAHNNIPTPHTVEYVHNTNPAGQIFPRVGEVRPATPDEVP